MFVSHEKLGTNIAQIVQNVCIFHLKYNSANIFVDLMLVWGRGLCKLCVLLTILLIVYTWYDNWSAEQLLCFVILDLLLLLPECCLITCGIWCIQFWPESCISKCSVLCISWYIMSKLRSRFGSPIYTHYMSIIYMAIPFSCILLFCVLAILKWTQAVIFGIQYFCPRIWLSNGRLHV